MPPINHPELAASARESHRQKGERSRTRDDGLLSSGLGDDSGNGRLLRLGLDRLDSPGEGKPLFTRVGSTPCADPPTKFATICTPDPGRVAAACNFTFSRLVASPPIGIVAIAAERGTCAPALLRTRPRLAAWHVPCLSPYCSRPSLSAQPRWARRG